MARADALAGLAEPRPAAACEDVEKSYGDVLALSDVSCEVPPGAVTVLAGPSGSGKSTLLRLLAGLDRPTRGRVRLAGRDLSAMSVRRRRALRRDVLGYVFQRPAANLLPYLDAREQVRLAAAVRGRGDGEVEELLDLLELGPRAGSLPHELSGGEQQRLAFAAAVVGGPALVVADEPTAQLDSARGAVLLSAVARLAERGTAVLLSSHDAAVIERGDTVLHLEHGRLGR